jgi:hypothetical protein
VEFAFKLRPGHCPIADPIHSDALGRRQGLLPDVGSPRRRARCIIQCRQDFRDPFPPGAGLQLGRRNSSNGELDAERGHACSLAHATQGAAEITLPYSVTAFPGFQHIDASINLVLKERARHPEARVPHLGRAPRRIARVSKDGQKAIPSRRPSLETALRATPG